MSFLSISQIISDPSNWHDVELNWLLRLRIQQEMAGALQEDGNGMPFQLDQVVETAGGDQEMILGAAEAEAGRIAKILWISAETGSKPHT